MDPDTPLEETMGALDQAVKSGKALYAGLSNYDGPTMLKASEILESMRCPFVINQNRYNILDRIIETIGLKETSKKLKKGIICFSPMAQGLLSGKYLNGIPDDSRIRTDGRFLNESQLDDATMEKVRILDGIAKKRGQSLPEMALAWLLHQEEITSVLIGASRPAQITANIKAIENIDFSKEELDEMNFG